MPFSDSSSLLRYSRIHGLLLRLEDVISLLCKTLRKGQGATSLEEGIEIDSERSLKLLMLPRETLEGAKLFRDAGRPLHLEALGVGVTRDAHRRSVRTGS